MRLAIKVKPGSKVNQLFYDAAGTLTAKIKTHAQDGKANTYLVAFLARQLGIPQSYVTLVSGFTNPNKRIDVEMEDESVQRIIRKMVTT